MLNINEKGVLKDLTLIKASLKTASLEECVSTLQLLTKSMNFLKEKRSNTDTEEEWNDFSKVKFNLGRHFVDIIRLYNEKLTMLIIENCSAFLEDNDNSNTPDEDNCNINSPLMPQQDKKQSNMEIHNNIDSKPVSPVLPVSPISTNSPISQRNSAVNSSLDHGSSSYPSPLTVPADIINCESPLSESVVIEPEHAIDNEHINSEIPNPEIPNPEIPNPEILNPEILSPEIPNPEILSPEIPNPEILNPEILSPEIPNSEIPNPEILNPENYTPSSLINIQDDNDISKQYVCTKEFKAKEDFQIDLKLNDVVTINQFTGKYVLGKNCDTNREGLFPIYFIERLDGKPIFFRCKEELEYASINDEIFLNRETESDYYPGFNITRDEQGFFSISILEQIVMDNDARSKYEALYGEETDNDDNLNRSRAASYSALNTSNYIDSSDSINHLTEPILPFNSINENNGSSGYNENNRNGGSNGSINRIDGSNNRGKRIIASNDSLSLPSEILGGEESNNENNGLDQTIIEKLLNYYDTLPNEDIFNKSKDDNNLDRMRDAIKKFQEFKSEDKKGEIKMSMSEKEKLSKIDSLISSKGFDDLDFKKKEFLEFEDPEIRRKKWETNRYRCLELIETEKSYCSKIKIMIERFKDPLEAVVGTENEMLNSVQIHLIFNYIPDIYIFSSKLCKELDEAFKHYDEEGPIPIARVFLNRFSDWQLYIKYVECYKQANKTLEKLRKSPQTDRFNRFMEECQRSRECDRSNLKDLIVLPIQRFLKYNIFFKDFRKNTDPRNRDSYDLLDTVENFIFEIGEIMNDAKKLQDSIDKMFSLARIVVNFPPDLISFTQRIYIGEWVVKEIPKKDRMLYLFSDIVIFAAFLNKRKNEKYKFEKRINILDYNVKSTTIGNKKAIQFVETEESKKSKPNNKLNRSSHSLSLLSFTKNTNTSITKSLFYFESEEVCDDFVKKYKEQKDSLLKNNKDDKKK